MTQSEVESGLDDSNEKDESDEEASEEKEEPGTKGKKAVPTKRKALDKGGKSKVCSKFKKWNSRFRYFVIQSDTA